MRISLGKKSSGLSLPAPLHHPFSLSSSLGIVRAGRTSTRRTRLAPRPGPFSATRWCAPARASPTRSPSTIRSGWCARAAGSGRARCATESEEAPQMKTHLVGLPSRYRLLHHSVSHSFFPVSALPPAVAHFLRGISLPGVRRRLQRCHLLRGCLRCGTGCFSHIPSSLPLLLPRLSLSDFQPYPPQLAIPRPTQAT